ncbi:zinc finger protein 511-like [Lingula anatina]|uniref:Zinc finger protein 511-like n=1 Tax=Lingula anatina TaxID=7574 RepID=A0A1S3I8N4_LINAN|nr:zinc finger protein 511-like [Lingula anatina]|eukprot:XP_013394553.1 zinc finger protein 511-like [Lingula anatina]
MCAPFKWSWEPVKRRLPPCHPLFEEGDLVCSLQAKLIPVNGEGEEEDSIEDGSNTMIPCNIAGCTRCFQTIGSYEAHYKDFHTHVCSECKRRFPTNHLLEVHILEWHDTMFHLLARHKNMYQCLVEACADKFPDAKSRKDHMIKQHHYPASYRWDRQKKPKPKKEASEDSCKMDISDPTETKQSLKCTDIGGQQQDMDNGLQAQGGASGSTGATEGTGQQQQEMDVFQGGDTGGGGQQRRFVYSVPPTICFGAGAARGFSRHGYPNKGKKKKSKQRHWHQTQPEHLSTTVKIEDIQMNDLEKALDDKT